MHCHQVFGRAGRGGGLVSVCVCLLLAAGAGAAPAAAAKVPAWIQYRVDLKQCYTQEEFRLFYNVDGETGLTAEQRVDADHDGVPDKIQDFACQLVVARRLYTEVLHLRHPFESPRYKGRVKFFDVHVTRTPIVPGGPKVNGSAGDAIVNYHRPTDPPGGIEVLTIDLSKDISNTNLSPAHELFHEFQYGYTLFKNAWFTEGTARWAEYAFRAGVGAAGAIPGTEAERRTLFAAAYNASTYWNALAQACDPTGVLALPQDLAEVSYRGARQRIIQDARLHGAGYMKALLEELAAADRQVSEAEKLNPLDWKEARQNDPKNNEIIWQVSQRVLQKLARR